MGLKNYLIIELVVRMENRYQNVVQLLDMSSDVGYVRCSNISLIVVCQILRCASQDSYQSGSRVSLPLFVASSRGRNQFGNEHITATVPNPYQILISAKAVLKLSD